MNRKFGIPVNETKSKIVKEREFDRMRLHMRSRNTPLVNNLTHDKPQDKETREENKVSMTRNTRSKDTTIFPSSYGPSVMTEADMRMSIDRESNNPR